MELFIAVAIGCLFGIGVFQMLRRNVIRSAIGLIILSNAVNLFLLSAGAYDGTAPAYSTIDAGAVPGDPLPQAFVLTAIVISMGGLAFVLALMTIISSRYKTSDIDEVSGLKY